MRLRLLITLVVAGLTTSVSADTTDDFVRGEMERQRIPGLSLAIVREGKLVRSEGYGLANVEHQVAVTPETVFQSGSVAKQLTATAVMLLVADGTLALDDPLSRHLGDVPDSWAGITVHHLLTHTSGIRDWWNVPDIDARRDYTEDEYLALAKTLPLDFAPGTQWRYSNTAYVLAGILVHRVSGQLYGDVLRERVFAPLGMDTARVISEADIVAHRAAGYRLVDGELKNQEWVAPALNTTADGALYLTALDWARWDGALDGKKILSPSSWREMWTPVRLADGSSWPYGLGWDVDEQRGHSTLEHGGAWQGFKAYVARYVDQRLTVIVLANLAEARPGVIAHTVAGLVAPELRLPDPASAPEDPDPECTVRLRGVLAAWSRAEASPDMTAALAATSGWVDAESWERKQLAGRLGGPGTLRFLAEDDVSPSGLERRGERLDRIVHLALESQGRTWVWRFYLNEAGRVVDLAAEER